MFTASYSLETLKTTSAQITESVLLNRDLYPYRFVCKTVALQYGLDWPFVENGFLFFNS